MVRVWERSCIEALRAESGEWVLGRGQPATS